MTGIEPESWLRGSWNGAGNLFNAAVGIGIVAAHAALQIADGADRDGAGPCEAGRILACSTR